MWRESASLILAARSIFTPVTNFNYKVLCLKRSSKSEVLPGSYVFPGGNLSKSDSSIEWFPFYEKFGFSEDSFNDLKPSENIPELLQPNSANSDTIPKHVSFRICAIRETFEECGVLLCKSCKSKGENSKWASFIGGHDLAQWQHKVHDDASQFIKLCSKYEIYPDVWALNLWSNWVTPPCIPSKFNTIFFLATLSQMPPTRLDNREVQDLMWATPEECLDLSCKEKVALPVPQFYEISRLKCIEDIETLAAFTQKGCPTFLPFRVRTDQGLCSILPGDDLYPAKIDLTDSELTFIAQLPECTTKNRILHKSLFDNQLVTENYSMFN